MLPLRPVLPEKSMDLMDIESLRKENVLYYANNSIYAPGKGS